LSVRQMIDNWRPIRLQGEANGYGYGMWLFLRRGKRRHFWFWIWPCLSLRLLNC
jgi:hypothetical protein